MQEKDQETTDAGGKADEKSEPGPVTKWVDDEFAGEHGTTLFEASQQDDRDPDHAPGEVKRKGGEEGLVQKVARAVHEADRQISGEYERREDRTAP